MSPNRDRRRQIWLGWGRQRIHSRLQHQDLRVRSAIWAFRASTSAVDVAILARRGRGHPAGPGARPPCRRSRPHERPAQGVRDQAPKARVSLFMWVRSPTAPERWLSNALMLAAVTLPAPVIMCQPRLPRCSSTRSWPAHANVVPRPGGLTVRDGSRHRAVPPDRQRRLIIGHEIDVRGPGGRRGAFRRQDRGLPRNL